MMRSKLFISLALLFSFLGIARSQELTPPKKYEVSIGGTKVTMENNEIIIDYDVLFGNQVLSCKVEATMLVNGKPFRYNEYFSGDIGIIRESGQKQIRYDISHYKEQLAGTDISFKLNVSDKNTLDMKIIVMATASPMSPRSYGLMAGVVKRIGGYARFQSNFSSKKKAFVVMGSAAIEGGGYMWRTGEGIVKTLRATAGTLIRVHKNIYPYAGIGYGCKNYLYEDYSGDWGLMKDLSTSGLAIESGLVFKAGPVAISAGASSTMFKTISLDVGVGVIF